MNTASTLPAKHRIAILALHDFVPFDLSIPYEIFTQATLPDGAKPYEVFFSGVSEAVVSGCFSITTNLPLAKLQQVDTVIIPGIMTASSYEDAAVFEALRLAAASGVRLASICTGAYVLAAAGILNGLSATTHWEMASSFAASYPRIAVEPDVLFIDNGQVLTSAGLSSGIDLCLHLIRRDYGAAAAERSAQFFVMPFEREGCQTQFIRRSAPASGDNLATLQLWLLENLHHPHTLVSMARHIAMSQRTLNRKFQEQAGVPPMAWLAKARIRRAQSLLESTVMPVEHIATATGFSSAAAFRKIFREIVGVSPTAWRKTYGFPGGAIK